MFVSRLSTFIFRVCSVVAGGYGSMFYRKVLFSLFLGFLLIRLPYIFGSLGFSVFILFLVFPLFLGLFFSRFDSGPNVFFSSLIPEGTPLWIAPFVCLAETLSYVIRPVVLMIRPFVNLTMGSLGGYALASLVFSVESVFLLLCFLFFYEVFVAVVHWFIVCEILSFSENH